MPLNILELLKIQEIRVYRTVLSRGRMYQFP
jgi:hypothetical protein